MAQTRAYKKTMNFVYGMGAAVVIIGALFKITHYSIGFLTGTVMLSIGLITEALVFAISAFDTPEDELDWSKVYPELSEEGLFAEEGQKKVGADGMLSQKLDNLLQEAKIDVSLMESLGTSMQNFHSAAEGLSAASGSVASTNAWEGPSKSGAASNNRPNHMRGNTNPGTIKHFVPEVLHFYKWSC